MIVNVESSKNSRFYPNKLYRDYIFDFQKLSDYFTYDYRDIENYRKRMKEIEKSYDNSLRKELVEILYEYNSAFRAGSETLKNIKMLGKNETAIIVGGQQPGLFTGPVFILYKIITVLKLSSFLNKVPGINTVPCFWNASDDSSIGQVNSMGFITGAEKKIKVDTSDIKNNTRFSNIYLEKDKYMKTIQDIKDLVPETGFTDEVIGFLEDNTRRGLPGNGKISLSGLFSNIILKLFNEYGIVLIDPSEERLKKMGTDFLNVDIENHLSIKEKIDGRGDKLEREGYHRQLDTKQNTLNHFFNVKDIREKIDHVPDKGYMIRDKVYSKKGLNDMFAVDPGLFSWNVVMRPVVQDSLFPVLATVCGPGEVSYFAQVSGVYELLGAGLPVIYPRFSATIIEKNIDKIIKRFGDIDDLIGINREQAIKNSLNNGTDINIEYMIEDLEDKFGDSVDCFEKDISDAGLRIGNSSDRIRRNIKKEVKVLKGKIYSELKKKNQWSVEALDRFYMNLFPDGGLQEREINFFHYANKYGIRIMDTLYDSFDPFDFEHKLLFIDQDGENGKKS